VFFSLITAIEYKVKRKKKAFFFIRCSTQDAKGRTVFFSLITAIEYKVDRKKNLSFFFAPQVYVDVRTIMFLFFVSDSIFFDAVTSFKTYKECFTPRYSVNEIIFRLRAGVGLFLSNLRGHNMQS
jgi:hypothetical protein